MTQQTVADVMTPSPTTGDITDTLVGIVSIGDLAIERDPASALADISRSGTGPTTQRHATKE